MACQLLDSVFQTDAYEVNHGGEEYLISLGVFLSTTGIDNSAFPNYGAARISLHYTPAGTTTITLPGGPHQPERQMVVMYPAQFSGADHYTFTQEASESVNANVEQATIAILQDMNDGGYTLTISSPSLTGRCPLQCVGNGNVAYGVLGGTVVAIDMEELKPGSKGSWPR